MTTKILFMCPHSAGKSLAAATYFRAAAARNGLDVEISIAGTDPDETNMPNVEAELLAEGFTIGWHPSQVTAADTANADHVVSIGCDHAAVPGEADITEWTVPMISEDLLASLRAIHAKVMTFADELSG